MAQAHTEWEAGKPNPFIIYRRWWFRHRSSMLQLGERCCCLCVCSRDVMVGFMRLAKPPLMMTPDLLSFWNHFIFYLFLYIPCMHQPRGSIPETAGEHRQSRLPEWRTGVGYEIWHGMRAALATIWRVGGYYIIRFLKTSHSQPFARMLEKRIGVA